MPSRLPPRHPLVRGVLVAALFLLAAPLAAHDPNDPPGPWLVVEKRDAEDAFRQLDEILPTPTEVRLASGAPGPAYWQQRVDHEIDVTLDTERHRIVGSERITVHNRSPHPLPYLWLQLDQNRFRRDSVSSLGADDGDLSTGRSFDWLRRVALEREFQGGVEVREVLDAAGAPLPSTIVGTMMRIDLPAPLAPGGSVAFRVDWEHAIVDAKTIRARGGYEWFDETGNAIYELAQWFPRLCAYTDVDGWQHKQFIGSGEFTLEFGDYLVRITVPDTHVVAATGELQNPDAVLTEAQRERLQAARTAEVPRFVITPEEAKENEGRAPAGTRTWVFRAENVRDFAFASSPKFIWDALGVAVPGAPHERILAMSYYPNEAEPLWSRFSTHAVAHTLEVYSKHTIPYPYPVAISVNGPVGGMEYPMICFNGPRPEEDGTYSERTKYGLISVVIHEVGHNWFPMIINSDERQWTWMDEGLNTFVQFLAEQTWEDEYPSRRGEPKDIVGYLTSADQVPIMTNSESLLQFGNNAYGKPATALNILRESILGRELFDFAFAEYARRWAFKRPQPADLFRTLEDASAIDLDWFWRGWFYSTDHSDIAIERVTHFTLRTRDPERDKAYERRERDEEPETLSEERFAAAPKRTDRYPELLDFYNRFDELDVTPDDRRAYERFLAKLDEGEAELLDVPWHFHTVRFRNIGGLVMPLVLQVTYEGGEVEEIRIPAEIWRQDPVSVSRLLITDRPIAKLVLDPRLEIADADRTNNVYPSEIVPGRFAIEPKEERENPMQIAKRAKEREETEIAAKKLAERLVAEWQKSPTAAPAEAGDGLLGAAEPESLLVDPFGSRFQVVFSGDPPDGKEPAELRFALIRCHGPDREAATRDDLRFVVYRDGRVENGDRGKDDDGERGGQGSP